MSNKIQTIGQQNKIKKLIVGQNPQISVDDIHVKTKSDSLGYVTAYTNKKIGLLWAVKFRYPKNAFLSFTYTINEKSERVCKLI